MKTELLKVKKPTVKKLADCITNFEREKKQDKRIRDSMDGHQKANTMQNRGNKPNNYKGQHNLRSQSTSGGTDVKFNSEKYKKLRDNKCCYRCGKNGHRMNDCSAKKLTCHKCQKKGHIAPACFGGPPPQKQRQQAPCHNQECRRLKQMTKI